MQKELVNKVANSALKTINLENYFPDDLIMDFDFRSFLFQELILKEKDFRKALKDHDWSQYKDKILAVFCSVDAIIPVWAYMLVTSHALPTAKDVFLGSKDEYIKYAMREAISKIDLVDFENTRVVIKGCSDKPVPESAYLDLTSRLRPIAQSIMYGEPCSTVPIFKRPRVLVAKQ